LLGIGGGQRNERKIYGQLKRLEGLD